IMPESPGLYLRLSVLENLECFADLYEVPDAHDRIAGALHAVNLAGWSIWVAMLISTQSGDTRVAQQLAALVSLPAVAVSTLIAINVIQVTLGLAVGLAALLLVLNGLGWRGVSATFDREPPLTGTK